MPSVAAGHYAHQGPRRHNASALRQGFCVCAPLLPFCATDRTFRTPAARLHGVRLGRFLCDSSDNS
ncbi:hypothetical protein PCL1606_25420 [Pseudomonas chlororaphis]|uniref:Uncharacterized protein n=1 Tax=Pseudomonas chlororaphis TaxID=587753 RepID=A0A0D5XYV9_9PSED|nr:hypothetical protein PCL1606_25420 [Pseudomonas chlororaphis]